MSILKSLVSAPLAGAFLITAVSLGGAASAQAAGAQFKAPETVAIQKAGFPRRAWRRAATGMVTVRATGAVWGRARSAAA